MKRGYTLVELLLVVAIIALLYSLYMNAISQAKVATDRAICSHTNWQLRVERELQDHYMERKVAQRCYDCHASAP